MVVNTWAFNCLRAFKSNPGLPISFTSVLLHLIPCSVIYKSNLFSSYCNDICLWINLLELSYFSKAESHRLDSVDSLQLWLYDLLIDHISLHWFHHKENPRVLTWVTEFCQHWCLIKVNCLFEVSYQFCAKITHVLGEINYWIWRKLLIFVIYLISIFFLDVVLKYTNFLCQNSKRAGNCIVFYKLYWIWWLVYHIVVPQNTALNSLSILDLVELFTDVHKFFEKRVVL